MTIINRMLVAVFLVAAILPPLFNASWDLWALSVIHLLTIIAVTLYYFSLLRGSSGAGFKSWTGAGYFLLYLLFCLLSYFFSQNRFNSRNELFNQFNYFLLFFLALNLLDSDKRRLYFREGVVAIAVMVSLIAIWQGLHQHAAVGTMLNTNILSGYLVLIIPLALISFLEGRRLWRAVMLAVLLAALLFSRSVGGWLAVFIGCAILAALISRTEKDSQQKNNKTLYAGIILFAAVMVFFLVRKIHEPGVTDRVNWWWSAVKMIKDHPLAGVGIGNFGSSFLHYKTGKMNTIYAHDHYLQMWAEIGFLGFLCLLGVIYSYLRISIGNLADLDRSRRYFTMGAISGIFSLLAYSIIDYTMAIPAAAITFWILMGASYPPAGVRSRTFRTTRPLTAVFLIVILLAAIAVIKPFLASQKYVNGIAFLQNGDLLSAEEELQASIRLDPLNSFTYGFLSDVYRKEHLWQKSIDSLREAIRLDPDYGPFHQNLALVYEDRGDIDLAIKEARLAINCHPQKALYHYTLGLLYEQAGNHQAARLEQEKYQEMEKDVGLY